MEMSLICVTQILSAIPVSTLVCIRLPLPFISFYTNCKGSRYPNLVFLKACSLIQVFNWLSVATAALNFLIHRSVIHCWIFHCVLDRTSIVCYPRKGSSLSIFPVCCLFSVFQCFTVLIWTVVGGKGYGLPSIWQK